MITDFLNLLTTRGVHVDNYRTKSLKESVVGVLHKSHNTATTVKGQRENRAEEVIIAPESNPNSDCNEDQDDK